MYSKRRDEDWRSLPEMFDYFKSEDGQFQLKKFWDNVLPFFLPRKNIKWSKQEDDFLISIANTTIEPLNYPILAFCFPGRKGKQVEAHVIELMVQQKIFLKDDYDLKPLLFMLHSYFLPEVENKIAKEFVKLSRNGTYITKGLVREMARKFYYSPDVLSERATFQKF